MLTVQSQFSFLAGRRNILAMSLLGCVSATCTMAQDVPQELIETAPNLAALVQLIQARDARPSTHLLLSAPDVMPAGEATIEVRSELPGTRLLILARGRFEASSTAATGMTAPPSVARPKNLGEVIPAERLPRPVWLASLPFKAGEEPTSKLKVVLERTQTLTLFAHAQGRWWFVTREVKVGQNRRPKG